MLYEEVNEGFEGSTKNIIKMQENCIDITKRSFNVHMVFEKNREKYVLLWNAIWKSSGWN